MNKYDFGTAGIVYSNKEKINLNDDYLRLAQIGNFDDYESLNYDDYQKWLTQKQNVVTTNEELAKTLDANYDLGYSKGCDQAKFYDKSSKTLLVLGVLVATPFIISGVMRIISHVQDIKAKKIKNKIQEEALASYRKAGK